MMRWIKYILILIIVYLFCSARTCTEDEETAAKREEQNIIRLIESVETVFTSDSLSDDILRRYEITAINKLNDFSDYLKIVSDTILESQFRQQAAEMAGNLFIPGVIELRGWIKAFGVKEIITLEDLIRHSFSEGLSYRIKPVGININDQFVRENDSTFTGSLSFYQKYVSLTDIDKVEDLSGPYVMDIYLIREIKNFGTKQLEVWEVYLGDSD